MKLKQLFTMSALATSLALVGCGGDINITPTVNDNSTTTDNSNQNNTNNPPPVADEEEVVCASYTSENGLVEGIEAGNDCLYNDSFASANISITSNITFEKLPDGGVHVFEEALQIGADGDTTEGFVIPTNGPTMTVEPGATIAFKSGEAILRIARGAKLQAVGTLDEPITFTSAFAFPRFDDVGNGPRYADWGGIIINGNGITDQCTEVERTSGTCNRASEGIPSFFGGNDNSESSGALRYARIWYAGSGPREGGGGDDLNSLTLNAVGAGTSLEYIHIHQGFDDGVELFGGAVDLQRIVVTDTQDDSFDFDAGWNGDADHLFIMHGSVTLPSGDTAWMGNGGFEADGLKSSPDTDVREDAPEISNVTIITTDELSVRDGDPSTGIKFDDFFIANMYNFLIVKTEANAAVDSVCISHSRDGETLANQQIFDGSALACDLELEFNSVQFEADVDGPLVGTDKAVWFDRDGANVRLGSASDVLAANGFATNTASTNLPASSAGAVSSYIGAVSDQDTSSNWYQWVEAAVTAANAD